MDGRRAGGRCAGEDVRVIVNELESSHVVSHQPHRACSRINRASSNWRREKQQTHRVLGLDDLARPLVGPVRVRRGGRVRHVGDRRCVVDGSRCGGQAESCAMDVDVEMSWVRLTTSKLQRELEFLVPEA